MQRFEFMVVPAPRRGQKARGVKTTEDRFALALTQLMNAMAAEGWDYVRADILPCDERVGLTGTRTTFQNLLVFRRALVDLDSSFDPAPRLGQPEALDYAPPRLGPAHAPLPPMAPSLGPAMLPQTDAAEGNAPPVTPPPPAPGADSPQAAPGWPHRQD